MHRNFHQSVALRAQLWINTIELIAEQQGNFGRRFVVWKHNRSFILLESDNGKAVLFQRIKRELEKCSAIERILKKGEWEKALADVDRATSRRDRIFKSYDAIAAYAKSRAAARPMPDAAPVTSATLPASCPLAIFISPGREQASV